MPREEARIDGEPHDGDQIVSSESGARTLPNIWTRERLATVARDNLTGFRLICVSNREPYSHVLTHFGLRVEGSVGGVVAALDPVMRVLGGSWVAHGSGSGDRQAADTNGRLFVPPGEDLYTLRRVFLEASEETGYYDGFANQGIWPLCHIAYQRPSFEESDWDAYVNVNRRFADAVAEEAEGKRAIVFVNDYHLALLPRLVKERMPDAVVFQFWHIPWPTPEIFRICPWKTEILEGMLGNDLLSFHLPLHCSNFLDTVDRELESRIDWNESTATHDGRSTLLRPQAIGIDFEEISEEAGSPATEAAAAAFRYRHGLETKRIILGIDRLDYTKGIPERLNALDRLFERHPEYRGNVVHVEIGVPTRGAIPAYRALRTEVEARASQLNIKYGSSDWKPVLLISEQHERKDLLPLYRTAEICAVTPVHDGMNLVAKEYVASRPDNRGVLVLSSFAGAARELPSAIAVNPYAVDATAEAFHAALTMPGLEQSRRMERMRQAVRFQNVYRWVGKLLVGASRLGDRGIADPFRGRDRRRK
jgi:trehalose 6-phosphate synthase